MNALFPATHAVPSEPRPLLAIEGLSARYGHRRPLFGRAPAAPEVLRQVSLSLRPGETLALVGESGSGKSTLARIVAGLQPSSAGHVLFSGGALPALAQQRSVELRRQIQIVFQNPDASLNHRHRVGQAIQRPLELFFDLSRAERERRVIELLHAVRLPEDYAWRYPAQISGGERQRVALARALAARPRLLLCDEIVSALDVSVQASVLALLGTIKAETGLSLLFITHDLAVARWFADRIAVLYRGELCEVAPVEELFASPRHPYTQALLAAHRPSTRPPAAPSL
ncbi:ABC transporter ATP-binding protein [Ancylobacter sonchi]|uniref:ABC transporter ATP-binding protein n=1 Tax=Ancylobacter sonchi TaxID=1937790 RepID=UPI001BD69C28|nr:ATP-binding cassette domain-containing protein [Ancylobacter sonchi]MBS7535974.1 ABC transporter ATP-binding protein [Ancylobacter sonchi]